MELKKYGVNQRGLPGNDRGLVGAMLIWVHTLSLIGVVFATAMLIPMQWRARRPFRELGISLWPFLILGVLSNLLLNANGAPLVEWLLPAIASALTTVFCRSERIVLWLRCIFPTLACFLWLNFLLLVGSKEYTANPAWPTKIAESRTSAALNEARREIERRFSPEDVVREDFVADILGEESFSQLWDVHTERQWHTFFTRLSVVERRAAGVWCPGGLARISVRKLEIRPLAP